MCEMASLPTKRLRRSTPSPHPPVDIEKCIICQTVQPHLNTTSSDNGRKRIAEAASIRKDVVCDRLKLVENSQIVYHISNDCYKQYTLKKTLDRIGLAGCSETSDPGTQQAHLTQILGLGDYLLLVEILYVSLITLTFSNKSVLSVGMPNTTMITQNIASQKKGGLMPF